MKPFVLAAGLAAICAPCFAGTIQGAWKEGRFADLSAHVFEQGGVRVSNCHLEFDTPTGAVRAVPKCYVMNASNSPAEARVDFVVIDRWGEPVFSAALSTFALADMTGGEVLQIVPLSADDRDRIASARVRVWTSTK